MKASIAAALVDLALGWGAPLVVGLLAPLVMGWLKRILPAVGEGTSETQRVTVALIAAIGNMISTVVGIELGADPLLWTDVEIRSTISASIAYGVHAANRAKAAKAEAVTAASIAAGARNAATGALARELEREGMNPFTIDTPPTGARHE